MLTPHAAHRVNLKRPESVWFAVSQRLGFLNHSRFEVISREMIDEFDQSTSVGTPFVIGLVLRVVVDLCTHVNLKREQTMEVWHAEGVLTMVGMGPRYSV